MINLASMLAAHKSASSAPAAPRAPNLRKGAADVDGGDIAAARTEQLLAAEDAYADAVDYGRAAVDAVQRLTRGLAQLQQKVALINAAIADLQIIDGDLSAVAAEVKSIYDGLAAGGDASEEGAAVIQRATDVISAARTSIEGVDGLVEAE